MPDFADIMRAIRELASKRVLVGIPADKDPRPGDPIGNAAIGYIHEFGSPLANIPARPHLVPGVRQAMPEIVKYLEGAARSAARGNPAQVDQRLRSAGQTAASSVKNYIATNIPPPLAPATVRARTTGYAARRREAAGRGMTLTALAREEIMLGELGAAGGVIALRDTGNYQNSITYVIRTVR